MLRIYYQISLKPPHENVKIERVKEKHKISEDVAAPDGASIG